MGMIEGAAFGVASGGRAETSDLTDDDRAVLDRVDAALADGVSLLRWWQQAEATGSYARRFELIRTFNRPDYSYAFFDQAPVPNGTMPVSTPDPKMSGSYGCSGVRDSSRRR